MKEPLVGVRVLAMGTMLAWAWGAGCTSGRDRQDATLELRPPEATLTVVDGEPATRTFTALIHHGDGRTEDVSARARFSLDDIVLGRFDGARLAAEGLRAGQGTVRATFEDLSATARITVRVERTRVEPPAPAEAPALLQAAAEDPALAPTIAYPADRTMVPPNLGIFEVHWRDGQGADLFEVAVTSRFVAMRVYAADVPAAGAWAALRPEEWGVIRRSSPGETLTVTVRGMRMDRPGRAGTSEPITVRVTDQNIAGGIYYWAAQTERGAAGIYRHDMGRPGEPAEPFYTAEQTPDHRCVACHVLSRDGTRMAVTYDGGDHSATILDVATRTELLPLDTYYWNFATFTPGGARLLTTFQGEMTLRDAATGEPLGTVEGTAYGTHPDFSPRGDAIVFVEVQAHGNLRDWSFSGGLIRTAPYDPDTGTFGKPTTLVEGQGNNYYPSWSPDGAWILFNRADEDAYDAPGAELWVVAADGSTPPRRIDAPNLADGLTNSWARWAPFEHSLDGEPLFWFTFSSKRDFGVRLQGKSRPQIWMAPFFPHRARRGEPPSAPAFRLPIQSPNSNNHIAQWTEQVVSIE